MSLGTSSCFDEVREFFVSKAGFFLRRCRARGSEASVQRGQLVASSPSLRAGPGARIPREIVAAPRGSGRARGGRPGPSGGGAYPLELY